jgi:hypothetical protein
MGWILRKFDSLAGTLIAAVTGLAAWQLLVFINAYQQRLGGHRDEAQRSLADLVSGKTGAALGEPVLRERLVVMAQERLDALDGAQKAIGQADVLTKPFVFFTHMDHQIALATARDFQPAVPLDAPSLALGVIGMVIGWLVWEFVKAPVALVRRRRRAA